MPRSRDATRAYSSEAWWTAFDPRVSLRARVAAIVGTGAILFVLLTSWTAGSIHRRQLERHAGAAFESLAYTLSDKLDRALLERFRQLQFISGLAAFDRVSDATERRRLLEDGQDKGADVAWMGLVRADGVITAATQRRFEETSVADETWFQLARQAPTLRHPQESPELAREIGESGDGTPPKFLTLALPLRDARGNTTGVLAASLRWTLARDLQLSVVPETARREQIGVTIYSGNGEPVLDSGGTGWTAAPSMPAVPAGRRTRGAMSEATAEGVTFVTGYALGREHRPYRGFTWFVAVRQPESVVFAPVREMQRAITGWGLALALVFTLGAWVFAARVVRPLRIMTAAARRIHEGDVLAVMPRPPGEHEVARMCGAVGDLVEDLRPKPDEPDTPQSGHRLPW